MVTRGTYYDEDEQSFRRYSNRGHGYPLSHDRDLPPAPHQGPYARSQHTSSHNIRQSPEQDNNTQPRRRIPVACGRCRKRKIRCSGDPGNGQPCSNCKSAGNDTCQFLRVSSTEAQMKGDAAEYGYDSVTATSRIHCSMRPYGPQHHQPYTSHVTPLGADGYPYRTNSIAAYQKPLMYYGIPTYSEFADENVDYGMPTSNYTIMNQEPLSLPYTSTGSLRSWQVPQLQKNSNSLFVDQESSYNHGQLPFHSNAMIRPMISPESKPLSLNGMSNALPAPITGTDRVLPYPATNRPAPMGSTYLRSSAELLPLSQPPMQFTNNGSMSTNMLNTVKSINASAASENASMSQAYHTLASSPDSMSFGTQSGSVSSQNHEPYTPSDEAPQHGLFQHSNDSSNDMRSYGHSNPNSQRPSISSNTGDATQSHQGSSGSGSLSDGRYYQPIPSQVSYGAPPMMPLPPDMPPAASIPSRQPVSAT